MSNTDPAAAPDEAAPVKVPPAIEFASDVRNAMYYDVSENAIRMLTFADGDGWQEHQELAKWYRSIPLEHAALANDLVRLVAHRASLRLFKILFSEEDSALRTAIQKVSALHAYDAWIAFQEHFFPAKSKDLANHTEPFETTD